MGQEPKKVDRRNFIYAGLGAVALIAVGAAAYIALNPPVVTQTTTVSTTVPTTSIITQPTTTLVTTTVPTTSVVTTTIPTTSIVTTTQTTAIPFKPPFTYWHEKGYTEEEDKAWDEIVRTFLEQYGIREYELVLPPTADFKAKLEAAVSGGSAPDVAMSSWASRLHYAYEGMLVDLTEIIEPVKDKLAKVAVEGGFLYDKTIKGKSYYTGECFITAYFLHINKDLIKKAGEDPENIPTEWNDFHDLLKRVQKKLGGPPPYAFGYPQSTASTGDGMDCVQQLFMTLGGEFVSKDNELVIEDTKNKEIFIETIDILTSFIKEGYCPKEALTWKAPENNTAFNTGLTVMMWNGTLSIPNYWLSKDPKMYYEGIATIDAPRGPHGEEWCYLLAAQGHETWKISRNIELAKKFIAYMLEPEPQKKVVKTMLGRYLPSRKEAAADPQIKNGFVTPEHPVDPNYPAFYRQAFERKNFVGWEWADPALSEMLLAGVLTDPCARVVVDHLSPREAVEEQIPRIKSVWKKYYG